eukprot:284421-Chlamydomonas_euryale.AAC.2
MLLWRHSGCPGVLLGRLTCCGGRAQSTRRARQGRAVKGRGRSADRAARVSLPGRLTCCEGRAQSVGGRAGRGRAGRQGRSVEGGGQSAHHSGCLES